MSIDMGNFQWISISNFIITIKKLSATGIATIKALEIQGGRVVNIPKTFITRKIKLVSDFRTRPYPYNAYKIYFFTAMLLFFISCGGNSGSDNSASNNTKKNDSLEQKLFYVDAAGYCDGRSPCYSSLSDALHDSFISQFDDSYQALRPDAPADKIIVMPGEYFSTDPSDYVLNIGIIQEHNPKVRWKLEIIAEQGPSQTFITGRGVGPCIQCVDNLDLKISGFTITDCYEYNKQIINQDYAFFIQSYYNANITIENNIFDGNASESGVIAISPYFMNVTGLNIKISKNKFVNNQGSQYWFSHSIYVDSLLNDPDPIYSSKIFIDNNIIYNNLGGIQINTSREKIESRSVDVVYNTIVNNKSSGLDVFSTGINLQNNIIYGNEIDIRSIGLSNNISNNILGEVSMIDETTNFVGDPLLKDILSGDFSPTNDSPAIDKGALFDNSDIESDYLGNPRVVDGDGDLKASPDIGAIEIQ
jgi:hypothetical protein